MIRKTFKQNIELPINDTVLSKYWLDNGSSQTVKTEWTVDMQGDELMDMDIVSCDADLDERQYDRLKEICLAMRHMPAITVDLIDEPHAGFSKFDVTVQSDESYNFLQSHFREA